MSDRAGRRAVGGLDDDDEPARGETLVPDDVADAPHAEAAAARTLDARNVTLEEPTRSTPALVEELATVGWVDGAGGFVSVAVDLGGEPVTLSLEAEEARRLAASIEASLLDVEELREEAGE
jgi:hypothetical protein